MRKKGAKVEEWNWQVHDRLEGFLPEDDINEEQLEDFDLVNELDKVEKEINVEKGKNGTLPQRALSKSLNYGVKETPVKKGSRSLKTPSTSHTHLATP